MRVGADTTFAEPVGKEGTSWLSLFAPPVGEPSAGAIAGERGIVATAHAKPVGRGPSGHRVGLGAVGGRLERSDRSLVLFVSVPELILVNFGIFLVYHLFLFVYHIKLLRVISSLGHNLVLKLFNLKFVRVRGLL